MTVSSEAVARRVVIPEVVGLTAADAQIVLGNAGIHRVRLHYVQSYGADREVVEQQPVGGALITAREEVTLFVSRQSLMAYLPQVYHSLPDDNVGFLRGLLYIVQHVFDGVTDQISDVHRLFDPRHTEPEFLPWLASWLAITLNPEWDDLHRRRMLRAAAHLFPHRGTAFAIREFVRIYTGADVEVEENVWPHVGFRVGVACSVGTDTVVMPSMNLAHCFVVRIDLLADEVDDEEVMKIHQIIQAQKPAHTTYCLCFRDEKSSGGQEVYFEVGAAIGVVPESEEPPEDPAEDDGPAPEPREARPSKRASTRARAASKRGSASSRSRAARKDAESESGSAAKKPRSKRRPKKDKDD